MAQSAQTQSLKGPGLAAALAAAVAWITPGAQPFAAFLSTFAVSYSLQAWSMREARKKALEDVAERKSMIRSAVAAQRMVFGEALVSGPLVYAQVTGGEKEYLHMVVALAGHEVQGIGEIYLDDVAMGPLDGSGNTTTGEYSGLAQFHVATGSSTQTAMTDLVTASGGKWTANHRGRGITYLYARLLFDQDKYPGGIPQIRAIVRGALCYDPRDAATRYTHNPALILRHYLTASYGLGCVSGEIDDAAVIVAADVCDEWVALDAAIEISVTGAASTDTFTTTDVESRVQTGDKLTLTATSAPTGLTGGGTYYVIRTGPKTFQLATSAQNAIEGTAATFTSNGTGCKFTAISQRRYTASGTATYDMAPKDIVDDLIGAMAGTLTWTGGLWRMTAGSYVAPTVDIDADDLRGPVTFRNRTARNALTNTIRGAYVEPARTWVQTDYAPVSNAAYVTADGSETIERALDHAWCTNAFRAQRLAKITLEKSRTKHLTLPCKITALPLLAADTISVTIPQLGLTAAPYRVMSWRLSGEDGGIGVDLDLEEEAASHYSWTASDGVAPPINTAPELPSAFLPVQPTSLTMASGNAELLAAADGSIISRMRITWGSAPETNLIGYEVQYRRGTDTAYISINAARDQTTTWAAPVEDGVSYDVRVRSIAAPGTRRSSWVTGTHTVAGKTAAPTAPTSLSVLGALGGFDLAWSASPDADYAYTEVWEASVNDRASATKLANVAGNRFARAGLPAAVDRWYWVRHVDFSANQSAWFPSSATAGETDTTDSVAAGTATVTDASVITATPGSPPPDGDAYWAVYSNADGKIWRWVTASGAYTKAADGGDLIAGSVAADKIAVANLAAISANIGNATAGTFTLDSSGYIKAGASSYASGAGIWMGYDGGAYKMRVGDPAGTGKGFQWDGSTFNVDGEVIATGNVISNAITNKANAYTAGTLSVGASWTTVQTVVITATGSPIHIIAACAAYSTSLTGGSFNADLRIQRNGTTIASGARLTAALMSPTLYGVSGSLIASISDTPSAGSHTYTIDVQSGATINVSARAILALELKR